MAAKFPVEYVEVPSVASTSLDEKSDCPTEKVGHQRKKKKPNETPSTQVNLLVCNSPCPEIKGLNQRFVGSMQCISPWQGNLPCVFCYFIVDVWHMEAG